MNWLLLLLLITACQNLARHTLSKAEEKPDSPLRVHPSRRWHILMPGLRCVRQNTRGPRCL